MIRELGPDSLRQREGAGPHKVLPCCMYGGAGPHYILAFVAKIFFTLARKPVSTVSVRSNLMVPRKPVSTVSVGSNLMAPSSMR